MQKDEVAEAIPAGSNVLPEMTVTDALKGNSLGATSEISPEPRQSGLVISSLKARMQNFLISRIHGRREV